MTVKCVVPLDALDPLVNVSVDEPLPGAATFCGLKLAVTPLGNPETLSASEELKPPKAAVVNLSAPLTAELTVTPLTLGVSEKPGTFSVKFCFCVTPPPAPVSVTT